ncbi:MAG: tRNA (adenosine(37)-N6)-threonylcarbamoyltransferase complex dimerization subunit type 1 TsaB [Acidobacteria bacterium]|nr:MAG: tRNA (adenosine(37)-N6)-threonylcarbamoyltransferase complex dimerization subunit type 1 TsaB [Acidobacteriota bacterium]
MPSPRYANLRCQRPAIRAPRPGVAHRPTGTDTAAMRVLALDTTTRAGSVALVEDNRVVDERGGDAARTHAERLPGEITSIADGNRLALSEVDLYGVASGPGSFTGLRIGIATVQGLAFVHHRRIVGVSALDALAELGSLDVLPGTLVAAWMDAHRRDVFSAVYRVTGAPAFSRERLVHVEAPTVGDAAATMARWVAELDRLPTVFIGDGAVMYAAVVVGAVTRARIIPPPPLAGAIGRLAIARQSESVEPGGVRPLYVRRPDAEIARDQKPR